KRSTDRAVTSVSGVRPRTRSATVSATARRSDDEDAVAHAQQTLRPEHVHRGDRDARAPVRGRHGRDGVGAVDGVVAVVEHRPVELAELALAPAGAVGEADPEVTRG